MNRHSINKAFVDIINSIDLFTGTDYNGEIMRLDSLIPINFGITKYEDEYIYGDYGKLKENDGDLYRIFTIKDGHTKIKKGVDRYQIKKGQTKYGGDDIIIIYFYQKYKHRPCVKVYGKTDIRKILYRDSFIDNILEDE